jgi:hypothetical protein
MPIMKRSSGGLTGVGEGVGDGVGEGVGDGVGLGVGDGVGEGVGDGVGLGVGDGVGVGVGDGVGEGVGDGVGLGVGDGVGVGEGVGLEVVEPAGISSIERVVRSPVALSAPLLAELQDETGPLVSERPIRVAVRPDDRLVVLPGTALLVSVALSWAKRPTTQLPPLPFSDRLLSCMTFVLRTGPPTLSPKGAVWLTPR